MTVKLENWTFITTNPFVAPECSALYMIGDVHGHPDKFDGERIKTHPVAISDEAFVSYSGKHYKLGTPAEGMDTDTLLRAWGKISVGRAASGQPILDRQTETRLALYDYEG